MILTHGIKLKMNKSKICKSASGSGAWVSTRGRINQNYYPTTDGFGLEQELHSDDSSNRLSRPETAGRMTGKISAWKEYSKWDPCSSILIFLLIISAVLWYWSQMRWTDRHRYWKSSHEHVTFMQLSLTNTWTAISILRFLVYQISVIRAPAGIKL